VRKKKEGDPEKSLRGRDEGPARQIQGGQGTLKKRRRGENPASGIF